eukprot:m.92414 g.92414  ORF g.92414 m.92414 type:complete len:389 (-) comp8511_c0_seq1:210-1376(-)
MFAHVWVQCRHDIVHVLHQAVLLDTKTFNMALSRFLFGALLACLCANILCVRMEAKEDDMVILADEVLVVNPSNKSAIVQLLSTISAMQSTINDLKEQLQQTPKPAPRFIYVTGGGGTGEVTDPRPTLQSTERYDTVVNAWVNVADAPVSGFGAGVTLDGYFYAVGGHINVENCSSYLSSLARFDPSRNNWITLAPMKQARALVSAVAFGGFIYAMGGYAGGGSFLHTVEVYSVFNNSWSSAATMSSVPRSTDSAVICNGFLYSISTPYVERYDPVIDNWDIVYTLPFAGRQDCKSVSLEGQIFVVGTTSSLKYDPINNSSQTIAMPLTPRVSFYLAVVGRYIYACGGIDFNSLIFLNSVERYDPLENRWMYVASMTSPRAYLAGGVL